MKDLYHKIGVVHLLDAQDTADTDTASSILDTKGFEGAVMSINVGAITTPAAGAYLTPTLQHSDTTADSDFEAVDSGDILGAYTKIDAADEDQVTQYVGYQGTKRYIRLLMDWTGTDVTAALVSVDGILGIPDVAPVTIPDAITAT